MEGAPRHKPKFKIDHGQLHEANILNVRPDMKEGVFVWQYMLHYKGWADKWDEWVSEDGIHHDNEEGRATQAEIRQKISDVRALEQAKKKFGKKAKPSGDPQSNIDKQYVEPKDKAFKVTLPATLQRRLLDDLDMIEERKLLPLPRTPCIRQVLDMFVDSRGKRSKQEQDEVLEMVQGLTAFFDMALPRMLLFSFESLKYKRVQSERPDLKPSQLYGGEHLLRLLMKMPTEMMTAKVTADKAMSLQPRLQELVKFLEKNEGTIMTNEWEPADTEYIEAFEEQLARS